MEHHFDVQEAVIYGVEKAVMLNNFRFWLTKNRANNHQNIDDYYWTFNSATALAEIWPYLNAKKISRLLNPAAGKASYAGLGAVRIFLLEGRTYMDSLSTTYF